MQDTDGALRVRDRARVFHEGTPAVWQMENGKCSGWPRTFAWAWWRAKVRRTCGELGRQFGKWRMANAAGGHAFIAWGAVQKMPGGGGISQNLIH